MNYKKYKNIEYILIAIALLFNLINAFADLRRLEYNDYFYILFSGHLAIISMYCMIFFSRKKNYPFRESKSFWVLPIKPNIYIYSDFRFIISKLSFYLLNIVSIISLIYYLYELPIYKIATFVIVYFLYSFIIVFICVILKYLYESKKSVHTAIYMLSMILLFPLLSNQFLNLTFYTYYPFTSLVVFLLEGKANYISLIMFLVLLSFFYVSFKRISKNWRI
ncbi:MAG: hypothetical protein GKR88_07850 [Flavobacteriaceae bacterium]|nr:MAG: hypothetical protein GKR88_07850 [Flavobacteriaceae bacterium]